MLIHVIEFTADDKHGLLKLEARITRKHNGRRRVFWRCHCACGKLPTVLESDLKNSSVASCGCYIVDHINRPYKWKFCEDCGRPCFTNSTRFKRCKGCAAIAKREGTSEWWITNYAEKPEFRKWNRDRNRKRENIIRKQKVRAQFLKVLTTFTQLEKETENDS